MAASIDIHNHIWFSSSGPEYIHIYSIKYNRQFAGVTGSIFSNSHFVITYFNRDYISNDVREVVSGYTAFKIRLANQLVTFKNVFT